MGFRAWINLYYFQLYRYADTTIRRFYKSFVTVKNTGRWAGKAVPQLYVRDVFSSISTQSNS